MLCAACKEVFFKPIFGRHVAHQPSYEALRASASKGCEICALFRLAVLQETAAQWGLSEDHASELHQSVDRESDCSALDEIGFLQSVPDENSTAFKIWLTKEDFVNPEVPVGGGFDFFSYKRNLYANSKRILNEHELSEARHSINLRFKLTPLDGGISAFVGQEVPQNLDIGVCKQWLNTCSAKHKDCELIGSRELPTRLIDVRDSQPRLVRTHGRQGQYVTLSHCWGTSTTGFQLPLTTQGNLSDRLRGTPLAGLPKLFQQVITLVRELGFGFLWIDCLCIIQDDEQDWQRECARMSSVYLNAALTVAGPGAQNADYALIKPRLDPIIAYGKLGAQSICTIENKSSTIRVRQMPDGQSEPRYVERREFPDRLSSRGWAVQERLLSTRTLYFGSQQTYFECKKATYFEDLQYPLKAHPFRKAIVDGTSSADLIETWYTLAAHYSYCNITNGNDKLPALSGLASLIAHRTSDTYCVGLWKSDLARGLSWSRAHFRDFEKNAPCSLYRATRSMPSWSWASCDHAVGWQPSWRSFLSHVSNINVTVTPIGHDPFGQVSKGELMITGKLKAAKMSIIRAGDGNSTFNDLQLLDSSSGYPIGRVYADKVLTREDSHEVWKGRPICCLLLGEYSFGWTGSKVWVGLVLDAVIDEELTCRRVGLVKGGWDDTTRNIDYFRDAEFQAIRLI